MRLGLDDNISPRGDLTGQKALDLIQRGKLTQQRLDQLKRLQAAHENGMEHYPVFVGAVCMAVIAGVENQVVNRYALGYTVFRAAYTVVYYYNTTAATAWGRSLLFWAANIVCIRLLWFAGKAFN